MLSERLATRITPELRTAGLQYGRFVVVGFLATLVHVAVYAGTIQFLGAAPLLANTLGFVIAVNLSFLGHHFWTFHDPQVERSRSGLIRFWGVALTGFLLNTLFVQLITGTLGLSYAWAIPPMVGVTPFVTFLISKFWAFRG